MPLKSSAETDQTMHVKKLPETRQRMTKKIKGRLYGTHTGPVKGSCLPKPKWKNLIIREYSEDSFPPLSCGKLALD